MLHRRAYQAIDAAASEIIGLGQTLMSVPEPGFYEHKTAALASRALQRAGIDVKCRSALTGFSALLRGNRPFPIIAICGELDAVPCPDHPRASRKGVAHACGHNVTIAAMYGAALGLLRSDVMKELDGTVRVIACPAEEYVDLPGRISLLEANKVRYVTGKPEMLHQGAFDDVAAAIMVHPESLGKKLGGLITTSSAACAMVLQADSILNRRAQLRQIKTAIAEVARISDKGMLQKAGVSYQCEHHPGFGRKRPPGAAIYVRAQSLVGLIEGRRALLAALVDSQQQVSIIELPGVLPRRRSPGLERVCWQNLRGVLGSSVASPQGTDGCTDMGDVSYLMPAAIMTVGGTYGKLHSSEFAIVDPHAAYVNGAKLLAGVVIDLLSRDAAALRRIASSYRPALSGPRELDQLWHTIQSVRPRWS